MIPIPNIESNKRGLKLDDQTPITEREISNIVNVRTDIKEATTKFGKKLQQAHDLFHQDDFEQAKHGEVFLRAFIFWVNMMKRLLLV